MRNGKDDLPCGWQTASIGDVTLAKVEQVDRQGPLTYIDIGSVDNQSKRITEPNSLAKGEKIPSRARQRLATNDVLVSMTRPNLNAVALVPPDLDEAIGSTGFDVLRAIAVEPKWLFNIVKSQQFVESMSGIVQGALYPAVRPGDIRKYEIPVPPVTEQRRIVAKIEALQERSRKAREALAEVGPLLEQFRQSLLAAAFRGDLTADWRAAHPNVESASELLERIRQERRLKWEQAELAKYEGKGKQPRLDWQQRYSEPLSYDDRDLPELPSGWIWASADDICSQITDGEHVQPPYTDTGLPMLTAKHVRDGFVTFEGAGLISEEDFIRCLARCAAVKDDLLIVSVGATTGRTALVPDCAPFALVRSVLLLKPLMNPKFLLHWTKSPWCFKWMTNASGASAQAHLYITATKRMPVPIPSFDEQVEMTRIIDSAMDNYRGITEVLAESESALSHLDQSILAKAFRGELVPQDPNDEPASVLLDRIREARKSSSEVRRQPAKPRNGKAVEDA